MSAETTAVGTLAALLVLGLAHLALILWAGYQYLTLRLLYLATKAQADSLRELLLALHGPQPTVSWNPPTSPTTTPPTSAPTPTAPSRSTS